MSANGLLDGFIENVVAYVDESFLPSNVHIGLPFDGDISSSIDGILESKSVSGFPIVQYICRLVLDAMCLLYVPYL